MIRIVWPDRAHPDLFIAQQVGREAKRPPITLPDGRIVPRSELPLHRIYFT